MNSDAFELYQVTASMNDDVTAERETRALWEMMGEQGLGEGTLIVLDGDVRDYRKDGMTIHQIPAWRWFWEVPGTV